MNIRLVIAVLMMWGVSLLSNAAERVAPTDTLLSPLIFTDLSQVTITKEIDTGGDEVRETYVVASVPKLGLYQRLPDGRFIAWDGQLATLQDNGFAPNDNTLRFTIYSGSLAGIPMPIKIYLGYRTSDGALKYGHFMVQTPNMPPEAEGLSLQTEFSVPYLELSLSASDPDGDTLSYELLSPSSGTGYQDAWVDDQGKLYVTLTQPDTVIELQYRVTDGINFSDPAIVHIEVKDTLPEKGLGRRDPDPETYGSYPLADIYGDVLGSPSGAPTLPRSVDLSANFPVPGDQGPNGSCVGWATAYAAKSYQERVEMQWDLSRADHLFSPAYIYNQIKVADCPGGSLISDALNLMVNQGVATLDLMPYNPNDCNTQPSEEARQLAANFKAHEWRRLSSLQDIKAALANRQPVVAGIHVYPQMQTLRGPDSIYNSAAGQRLGGHAVAIVGYDDDKAGGAFRIINSWSPNWGDNGYFWMPYDFALGQGIMGEAYVVYDADNGDVPNPPQPPAPPTPTTDLPNLQPMDWNLNYDPTPGGAGSLTWEVANTGTAVAKAGAYVNLMFSTDKAISPNDIYVVYEQIPMDLNPGESAVRDASLPLNFRIPDNIPSGVYYAALWVDDLDTVKESDETDNVSLGDGQVTISNTKPDLAINAWYTTWDVAGNAVLYYEILSVGATTTPAGWDLALVLSEDTVIGNGDEAILYQATGGPALPPGSSLSNFDQPDFYSVANVPSGVFWMAFVVDASNVVDESNERNNISLSGSPGVFGTSSQAQRKGKEAKAVVRRQAYNGRSLQTALQWRRVRISRDEDGNLRVEMLPDENGGRRKRQALLRRAPFRKQIHAADGGIFPIVHRHVLQSQAAHP